MAATGYLLILLVQVLSLCGATEYYVRPTEPTNTSCPAQPCLTLSQYISDSDRYFKSNTMFKFLPGTHHMDRPLTIGNVHNMSLEDLRDKSGEYPHLVTKFFCYKVPKCIPLDSLSNWITNPKVCCAALWLHNLFNVTVKGISITVQALNEPISGINLKNVSDIVVQLNTTCSLTDQPSFGITIFETTFVEIHSSIANNCSFGLVLHNTTNTHITKVTTMYNMYLGIVVHMATDTVMSNTITAHNARDGMHLSTMSNTYITNMTTSHNFHSIGISLFNMNITHIMNMTTKHNENGMFLVNMNSTYITNTTATHNDGDGVYLNFMIDTFITDMTTMHNNKSGMKSDVMTNTHISMMTAAHNGGDGLRLVKARVTHITNMMATHNGGDGLRLSRAWVTHITNMMATYNGGHGLRLVRARVAHITNMMATYNGGVGMSLAASENTLMTKVAAIHNGGINSRGGVFDGEVVIVSSKSIQIFNTSFTDVPAQRAYSTEDPASLPAVIILYHSPLHLSGCDFTRNNISAIKAYDSPITVSGDLTFSNNSAFAGTAFALTYGSVLNSIENSCIYFLNNHATNIGGVFYLASKIIQAILYNIDAYYPQNICFLHTQGKRSQKRFIFANNSAGKGGDILYGGQVALGLDGRWNCLDSFKNISNISQNGLSLISSDPSRVCLCNKTGQPDCLVIVDSTPHTVYPGQTITISAVVVGQDFGTVSGSAYAQFLQRGSPPRLKSEQEVQGVTQHKCNHLYYTIFSQTEVSEAVLILTAHDSYVAEFNNREYSDKLDMWIVRYHSQVVEPLMYSNIPVYVNISLLPCPPGFMLTTHTPFSCDCSSLLRLMHGFQCHIQKQTIGRSGLLWVGMIQNDNGSNGTVAASEYCPLDYCNTEDSNVTLSEPDSQCNYNHSGTLCGGCQPGLSLALGSAHCLQCSNKYLALLIPATLAGPVLVFSIKLLDLTISQGTLNGLIFYANVIKANEYIFLPRGQTNPLTVFIAWLNLDLGVETCLYQGLTAYSKTWLQFVFPFYIWIIAGLSHRVAKVMGNNSVPVLATLFLLSYAKLLRTIITALSYTMVYTSHGPKAVWTADGNMDYLGPQHAPLFATAVAVLLFLWLPYTLVLFLGQWLHRCNYRLVVRMLLKIKPFLDVHYDPLKSKHRYWFGALLLVRATILLISALIPANRSSVIVLCISVIAAVLTQFGQLVYRHLAVAMFDITFFMNLILLTAAYSFIASAGGDLAVSAYTLIGIAFVQFVGLVLFKVLTILKQSEKLMRCFHKGQPIEEGLELDEQAAIQREMESDEVEQDSEGSGSIESLPTY